MNKKITPAIELVEEAKIIIAKQKKIKDAWGELYEKYKDRISLIDGYIHHRSDKVYYECKSLFKISFHPHYVSIFRPKSLKGIEDNNGWIILKGKANEIPVGQEVLELYNFKTKEHCVFNSDEFIEIGKYTHWKPINKSNPPIF